MFELILSLLFPKRCVGCKKYGTYLCDNCFSHIDLFQEFMCPVCLKGSITGETHPSCKTPYSLDGLIAGVVYKGVVKRLLYRFKYPPYISSLEVSVGKIFTDAVSQNELFMHTLPQRPIVVEVPLSSLRMKKRGYNQSEILADQLSKEFNLLHGKKIITRVKNTKPQFQLNKLQRIRNVKDAFRIEPRFKSYIKCKTVFLVDDLATSCATLKECAKVLKRSGAKRVYGVTFAREL